MFEGRTQPWRTSSLAQAVDAMDDAFQDRCSFILSQPWRRWEVPI